MIQTLTATSAQSSRPMLHLLEEMSHLISHEYSEVIASLSTAERRATAGAQAAIRDAADHLVRFSELHKALYRPPSAPEVHLGDHIGVVCHSLSRANLAQQGIQIRVMSDDFWVPGDAAWRIGLIVAELVWSASRNGFSGRTGSIALRLSADDALLSCMVADNGRASRVGASVRGRRVLEAVARDLGGSLEWFSAANGNLVHLALPSAGRA